MILIPFLPAIIALKKFRQQSLNLSHFLTQIYRMKKHDMMESIHNIFNVSDSIDWEAMQGHFALQYNMDGMTDVHGYYEDYLSEIKDAVTAEINKELLENEGDYYNTVSFSPSGSSAGEFRGVGDQLSVNNNLIDTDRIGNEHVDQRTILRSRKLKHTKRVHYSSKNPRATLTSSKGLKDSKSSKASKLVKYHKSASISGSDISMSSESSLYETEYQGNKVIKGYKSKYTPSLTKTSKGTKSNKSDGSSTTQMSLNASPTYTPSKTSKSKDVGGKNSKDQKSRKSETNHKRVEHKRGKSKEYKSIKYKSEKGKDERSFKSKSEKSKWSKSVKYKSDKSKAGRTSNYKSDKSNGGKSTKYKSDKSNGGKSTKYKSDKSKEGKSIKLKSDRSKGIRLTSPKSSVMPSAMSSVMPSIDISISSAKPSINPSGERSFLPSVAPTSANPFGQASLSPTLSRSEISSRLPIGNPSNIPSKMPIRIEFEFSSQPSSLDIYKYTTGNCPNAGKLNVPCAQKLNLRRVCDKYDELGSFRTCWQRCKPSFCCIHDADPVINPTAGSCSSDENCAQYAYCYIVWWKFHDTIGPAIYLNLDQNDDFFDVENTEVRDNETAWNNPIEKPFYDQLFKNHWNNISYIIENTTGDGIFNHHAVFDNEDLWDKSI